MDPDDRSPSTGWMGCGGSREDEPQCVPRTGSPPWGRCSREALAPSSSKIRGPQVKAGSSPVLWPPGQKAHSSLAKGGCSKDKELEARRTCRCVCGMATVQPSWNTGWIRGRTRWPAAQAESLEHLLAGTSQLQSARAGGGQRSLKAEYMSSDSALILPKGRSTMAHVPISAALTQGTAGSKPASHTLPSSHRKLAGEGTEARGGCKGRSQISSLLARVSSQHDWTPTPPPKGGLPRFWKSRKRVSKVKVSKAGSITGFPPPALRA